MPVTINGDGSITGLSVGGIGSGVVNTATIADGAVTNLKQGPGSVIQYVQASKTEVNTRRSWNSTSWYDSQIKVTITPIKANSLIVVAGFILLYCDNSNTYGEFGIQKTGTAADVDTNHKIFFGTGNSNGWHQQPFKFHETAGSTTARTYMLTGKRQQGSGYVYSGWSSSADGGAHNNGNDMYAMEILQ